MAIQPDYPLPLLFTNQYAEKFEKKEIKKVYLYIRV